MLKTKLDTKAVIGAGVLLTVTASPGSASDDSDLVAPVYPNAIPVAHQSSLADMFDSELFPDIGPFDTDVKAFYTKEPIGKVHAFYKKQLGAMKAHEPLSKNVGASAKPHYRYTHPDGVSLYALEPGRHTQGEHGQWRAIGPFLERLYRMADTCNENLAYRMVITRYRHLATGFYEPTTKRDARGKLMGRHELIYRECEKSLEGKNRLWERWESCLDRLDEHDYRTLIVIETDP